MRKQTANIDYTNKDYEAFREMMINKLQEIMPEYTDISETDAGIVIIEALANGLDILSMYQDNIANDVLLPTTQDRTIATLLASCLGYTPYNQTASVYPQVFVLETVRDETTVIPQGTVVKTKESADLATLYYETEEDLILPAGVLGNEQDDSGKYLYTVNVVHGTTIQEDVIGSSTGAPLQTFKLNYSGVLVDSIILKVKSSLGEETWEKVDNFIDADVNSKVYTVTIDDFDTCYISFGNGIKGKIPEAIPNGIMCSYRIGGGEACNVNANIITELDSSVAYVDSTFNLNAIVYGHEKESLESIKQNAPAKFRTRDRLVTLEDYEDLLRINFLDFLQLKAVRDEDNKRLAHVYYMMRPEREMTPSMAEDISEFISERSMIGTTYDLNPYVAQPVNLVAKMYVDAIYDAEKLKEDVTSYIQQVIFSYGDLTFGDSLVKSDLENEIKSTFTGILSFRINTPTQDIISPNSPQNILTCGSISITTEYI